MTLRGYPDDPDNGRPTPRTLHPPAPATTRGAPLDLRAAARVAPGAAASAARRETYATSGIYVNYLGDEGVGRVRASYGADDERLVAVKDRYDPTDTFHLNQHIRPSR